MSDSCNSRHFSWLMKSCFPNPQHPPPHHPTPTTTISSTTISELPDDLLLECLSRVPHSSLRSLPLVCSRWSHLLDSPSFHLLRHRNNLIRLTLFAVSVSDSTLFTASYRLENDCSWKICSFQDGSFYSLFSHSRLSAIGRRIYVIGRTAMLRCDTWTGTVVVREGPLFPRKKFAAAFVGGKIYVAGGCARSAAVEEYDPAGDAWSVVANAPRKRYGCVGASVDGVFYIVGGLKIGGASGNDGVVARGADAVHVYASSMDLYDVANGVWLRSRAVPGGGCVVAACAAAGQIYVLSSHAVELSFWKFNGSRKSNGFGEWCRIKSPPLPAQVRLDSTVRFSCVGIGEKVVLIQVNGCIDDLLRRSGRVERGMKEGLVLVYDCAAGEWSRVADLPEVIRRAACVCVEC
ncbi:F-box/kelch-repeat protein At5g26960 [Nicotiana sylvestris]|uniref:F-box/kelch-repeat protein At5g26960 n=1 Tax=Nicotiana sylvestris TaxID=4096 RepID=A0A1U7YK68_NICSY|nr:PREDICTED: F-box/kelch-repeat protein At5g26960 [Nicotiana sylvestris]